ncbi:MAG: flagellar basal body L-ring protein FlgH [Proteobacteria bacterium]|nr:flagellar basal body L-ring protein FlgH [Pseudomonadota bacterium]MBU1388934.1 flagellar basal body L-ring protein FlgH [Pseudomonadota bacterium]MBU2431638.1 flagellar basal body L-ring protein FlgH [Pseudomonadota bacterium]MBU2482637.1 flagellar basal body L-ring protein FlgH [Pseudomonadota bacterium]
MKLTHILNMILVGIVCAGLSGCLYSSSNDQSMLVIPDGGTVEPVLQPEFSPARPSEGSLWVDRAGAMYEDSKATRVGDTVIVDIIENSSSSMDVNTEAKRKTGMDIGVPEINIFGNKTSLGAFAGDTKLIGTDFSNSFAGEATSDRSGQVTASIAARVTEVLPNGNLSLFGRRAMKVNNEVQYITVSGIIRPQDISSANRVQSTFLADSRIEYYGKGALADKQAPGWGTRIIDNLWPF